MKPYREPSKRITPPCGVRAAVAGLVLLASAACASASSQPGPPAASIGTTLDRPVPASVASLPLTDDTGHLTSLDAFRGKVVVLTDFLTPCQDVCPMTSANFAEMDRAVAAAHLSGQVQFVELTVDPGRDTPARLRAYRKLFDAPTNWALLTATTPVIAQVWKFFGAFYARGPEDQPAGIDWMTGHRLSYDVDHSDVLIYLDRSMHERFVIAGLPNTQGGRLPTSLTRFLNDLGRTHLTQPGAGSWTVPDALTALSWLLKTSVPEPSS